MNKIQERIVRIFYLFKRYLCIFFLLEIILPDIVFLADVDDTISRQSSLLVGKPVERGFRDRR